MVIPLVIKIKWGGIPVDYVFLIQIEWGFQQCIQICCRTNSLANMNVIICKKHAFNRKNIKFNISPLLPIIVF